MRFTIEGFQQERMVELKMDATDAVLLRWFTDFQGSGAMKEEWIGGKAYYWVWYQKVIEELPVLGIKSKDGIYRRFKYLCDIGVLEQAVVRRGTDRGAVVYFRKGPRFQSLISQEGRMKNRPRVGSKVASDSSTNDSSTIGSSQTVWGSPQTVTPSASSGWSYRDIAGLKIPISDSRYEELVARYGSKVADWAIEQMVLSHTSLGKTAKDYAWVALQYLQTEYAQQDMQNGGWQNRHSRREAS